MGPTVRTAGRYARCNLMTRIAFKVIDLSASVVFMALCVKAFCGHYFKDVEERLQRRKFPLLQNSPSLVPAHTVASRRQSASHHRRPPESY
jgi:hypothetical protein